MLFYVLSHSGNRSEAICKLNGGYVTLQVLILSLCFDWATETRGFAGDSGHRKLEVGLTTNILLFIFLIFKDLCFRSRLDQTESLEPDRKDEDLLNSRKDI